MHKYISEDIDINQGINIILFQFIFGLQNIFGYGFIYKRYRRGCYQNDRLHKSRNEGD